MNYLLFNPKAKNAKTAEDLAMIHKALQSQQIREYNLTDYEDYKDILKNVKPDDTIYLVGGDGTLNRFINDMNTLSIACEVYFYSAGTGNDFKRDVDPENRVNRIKINKYIQKLPTVIINDKKYRFINGVGFGLDGYTCENIDIARQKNIIKNKYTKQAVTGVLFGYKPCSAKVTIDGVTKEYKKVWCASTMFGKYYGGGICVAPRQSRFNSNHTVTCVVLHSSSRLMLAARFSSIIKGKHAKYTKMVDFHTGHNIVVEFSKPCSLQMDGEVLKNVSRYEVIYE